MVLNELRNMEIEKEDGGVKGDNVVYH